MVAVNITTNAGGSSGPMNTKQKQKATDRALLKKHFKRLKEMMEDGLERLYRNPDPPDPPVGKKMERRAA